MKSKKTSGYTEATHLIQKRFNQGLNHNFSGRVLHTDASSPYASLRPHQVFVALSALVNTNAKIVIIANSSGFFREFSEIWQQQNMIQDWELATLKSRPYHFEYNIISDCAPVFSGGAKCCAQMRHELIISLYKKLCPDANPQRLRVLDIARRDFLSSMLFRDYLNQVSFGDRIGRVPCPYCTVHYRRRFNGERFVYHDVKRDFPFFRVSNWHAKCPIRRILWQMMDSPLHEVVRETGFALTGRAALGFYANNLDAIGADTIAVKDFKESSAVMDRVTTKLNRFDQLVVTTRTVVNFTIDQMISMNCDQLLGIINSHRVVSDGSVFEV